MQGRVAQLWETFQRKVEALRYEGAVQWLLATNAPQEQKDAVLVRAGRENLAAIHVTQRDLTSNRRRPGVFE